jgi:sulfite exporter TauE/SafE
MNADRIVSLVALAVFLGFLGIVGFSVMRVDLWIAILAGAGLVAYDLYTQLWARRR